VVTVAALLTILAACSGDDVTFDTFTRPDGSVWTETDCPSADQLISGGSPDGLPAKGQTDRAIVEASVANNNRAVVVPRNGEVWTEAEDGTVTVEAVEDFMILTTITDPSECPAAPVSSNGVPVIYQLAD
jgi:hypothetical protein